MHLRLGFWELPNSADALEYMKYFSYLDIISFDQSSGPDFMGNKFRLCIVYVQRSALSVQIYLPRGIITCPGLPPGVLLPFLSVSFPSVSALIWPMCSNFKSYAAWRF